MIKLNEYKLSKYNYFSTNKFLFNFLSGEMIINSQKIMWKEFFEKEKNQKILVEKNFLIPKEIDEDICAEMQILSKKFDSTLRLTIYPTEDCNFRCIYCYEHFSDNYMTRETEDAIILFIMKNIRKYSGLEITWFGGEPLLKSDTILRMSKKIVDICNKTSRKYRATCISNGYLLDLEMIEKMLSVNITTYMITLDGFKDYHDRVRKRADGGETFNKIFDNLKHIKNECKNVALRVKIRVNVSNKSLEMLPEYVRFLSNEFGNNIRFSFMFRPVGNWDFSSISRKNYKSVSVKEIYKAIIKANVKLNCIDHYLELYDSICEASYKNAYIIKYNGEICKCNLMLDAKENKIGAIKKKGKLEIDKYNDSRWIITRRQEKCKGCFMACSCGDGNICVAKQILGEDFDQYQCGYNKQVLDELFEMLYKTETIKYIPYEIFD